MTFKAYDYPKLKPLETQTNAIQRRNTEKHAGQRRTTQKHAEQRENTQPANVSKPKPEEQLKTAYSKFTATYSERLFNNPSNSTQIYTNQHKYAHNLQPIQA